MSSDGARGVTFADLMRAIAAHFDAAVAGQALAHHDLVVERARVAKLRAITDELIDHLAAHVDLDVAQKWRQKIDEAIGGGQVAAVSHGRTPF